MTEDSSESFPDYRDPKRAKIASGISKHSRGRNGCLNCRRRRKKCDEGKPACAKCTTRGESCEWDTKVIFRLSGIGTSHPSMVQSRNLKPLKNYQITNITFDSGSASSQPLYHESQDSISMDSSSSSHEQSIWDTLDPHSTHSFSTLENERVLSPMTRTFDGKSTFESIQTGSSPEKRLPTKTSDISSRQNVQNSIPPKSSSRRVRHHSESGSTDRPRILGTFPTPISRGYTDASTSSMEMGDVTNSTLPSGDDFEPLGSFSNVGISQSQLPVESLQLEALDYLTCQSNNLDFLTSDDSFRPRNGSDSLHSGDSPDLHSNYYPDATYRDLHTTLYCHMVETARNTALTRQASPEPGPEEASFDITSSSPALNIEQVQEQTRDPYLRLQPLKSTKLTQRRQLELWCNYLDEIAGWLDMFDSERHFQFKIPLLAKSADHLHYSILALSARQLERKSRGQLYTESLGLYQEAIQLIVQQLYTMDTTVIASCVLLCVLEMMSSSPKAWCRHLDGCAMLLQAAGINGVVGGVRQSLFWCFARMDVWGGFLEDTLTKIPTSRWFLPSGSMIDAVTHFKAGSGSHSYANYAVFLCASVVNVTSNKNGTSTDRSETNSTQKSTYSIRWKALYDLLDDWYTTRPEDMHPLMAYPSNSDDAQEPFPMILYGSSPAINGNQLYHAAAILMLQDKPKGIKLPKTTKSILWHARQICGIAVSNSDHGARINSLQPLWIAGKIMSHKSEHCAILKVLAEMEEVSGWATAWRAGDLKDYWGNTDEPDTY